jgi:nucleotidyltransferase substrate binding protein (TIGR01987 family)
MEQNDIRWKQRFSNFKKSVLLLEQALLLQHPNIFEKAGIVQFYEITFELSWNLMKDFMEFEGTESTKTPRETLKKAFEIGIISDGHLWLEALTNRNQTSHIYDEIIADKIINEISTFYLPLLKEVENYFENKQ